MIIQIVNTILFVLVAFGGRVDEATLVAAVQQVSRGWIELTQTWVEPKTAISIDSPLNTLFIVLADRPG